MPEKDIHSKRLHMDFPREKGLQTYTAIYVPSTQDVNKPISRAEHERRVKEVRNFLTKKFGGTSTDKRIGSYTSNKGRVVQENVAVVENFSDFHDWEKHDEEIHKFVQAKAKQWGQESISFEFQAPDKPRRLIFVEAPKKKARLIRQVS